MLNHTKNADSLRDYSYLEALLIQRLSLKTYYGKIITYDIVNEIFQHCISHYPNHSYRDYAYPYRDDLVFEELIISNHCPEIVRLFNDPVNHFSAYFIQRLMRYANQEATDAYYSRQLTPLSEIIRIFVAKASNRKENRIFLRQKFRCISKQKRHR